MRHSSNFRKILRTAFFLIGLPLLALVYLSGFLLGQIGIVGIADRFGASPAVSLNALNLLLIISLAGFLVFVRRQFSAPGFVRRLRRAFPRFGFQRFNFGRRGFPGFNQSSASAASEPAIAANVAGEPVCKILFIRYQPAARNVAAQNLNFGSQTKGKTYAKTNNS